jgi:hypothetical protein
MAQLKKEGRFLPIDRVRSQITQALEDYPFTHVTANDDGNLVFLRILYTNTGSAIEIVFTPYANEVAIMDESEILHECDRNTIPDDIALLDIVRKEVDWV